MIYNKLLPHQLTNGSCMSKSNSYSQQFSNDSQKTVNSIDFTSAKEDIKSKDTAAVVNKSEIERSVSLDTITIN